MLRALFFAVPLLLLTQSAFSQNCERIFTSARARLHRCDPFPLHVLRLRGTPIERARAYGELLRGPLSLSVMEYFSHKVQDSLAQLWPGAKALEIAYNQVVRLQFHGSPVGLLEEIDAQSEGMGLDPIFLKRALALPDAATLLQGLGNQSALPALPSAGCTSLAAKTDTFYYGRNLDFGGTGLWDKHPLLISVEPPAGSTELRHIVIGADGLLFGGITGVNEAGITFAIHQNYTEEVGLFGVPVALIGELVLRSAHNLEEAEAILRLYRPASLWTFVLTNLFTGEVRAIESSPSHFLSRDRSERFFVQTNHTMHPETRGQETAPLGIETNSLFRMKRAFAILEAEAPSASSLARILSYQENPEGFLSAYHDVLKGHTLQTAIFTARPNTAPRLYLSIEEAPASGGLYAAFDLQKLWNGEDSVGFLKEDLARTPPAQRQHQVEIARAFHTYFDLHDPVAAGELLAQHRTLDAELFRAIAAYQAGDFSESARRAEAALRNPRFLAEPAYILQSLESVRMAGLWQAGKKSEARSLATLLRERQPANPRVAHFARLLAQGKTPPAWMFRLSFDFFSGDLSER